MKAIGYTLYGHDRDIMMTSKHIKISLLLDFSQSLIR